MPVLSADWVLPVDGPPVENGAVEFADGLIVAVGSADELGEGTHFADAAIVPGFVNAHTHLEYAVYGGFGDGLADFADWIGLHVERKARIGWEEFVAVARLGAADCLASGVTTVGDCSYSGAAAVACADLGLRATVYLEVFGADAEAALARFAETRERVAGSFSTRVRTGVSPHTPYTASRDVYRACAELGLPMATHLSESASELAYLATGDGPWASFGHMLVPPAGTSGIQLLEREGLLGPDLVAAHCVHVDDDEIEALAAARTGVAHCPRSNAALGCGAAPLAALRRAGVSVGVGTDSPASAPSFDFFDELRTTVLTARARERRPDALTAEEALELGTLGSARALGLDAETGSITPGKQADLTIVSLEDSPYLPWENPAAAVVFGGCPERVVATLVGGDTRYEKGVQWHEELRSSARQARSRLLGGDRAAGTATPA